MEGTLTIDLSDGANLRAALCIQRLIKLRIAISAKRVAISESMYVKKFDMKSGRWYFVNRRSGETTWDVPRGKVSVWGGREKGEGRARGAR